MENKSPFHRYPDLQNTYNNALFKRVRGFVGEEEEGITHTQFDKVHQFCLLFEKEEFGQSAVEYAKMEKELRDLIHPDFVFYLKEEGYFDHFGTNKNTNTVKKK